VCKAPTRMANTLPQKKKSEDKKRSTGKSHPTDSKIERKKKQVGAKREKGRGLTLYKIGGKPTSKKNRATRNGRKT